MPSLIEHDDAINVIRRYDGPGTLFYVDPPYLSSTRCEQWKACGYAHELAEGDHVQLAEVLASAQAMVAVSGYPSELYGDLYKGWETVDREAQTSGGKAVERLWLSPSLTAVPSEWARQGEGGQMIIGRKAS